MKDEATPEQLAMARRIAEETRIDGPLGLGPPNAVKAALAAIIETRERDAALAEADAEKSNACFKAGIGGDAGKDRNAARYRTALRIATAIRAGQHYGKDRQ